MKPPASRVFALACSAALLLQSPAVAAETRSIEPQVEISPENSTAPIEALPEQSAGTAAPSESPDLGSDPTNADHLASPDADLPSQAPEDTMSVAAAEPSPIHTPEELPEEPDEPTSPTTPEEPQLKGWIFDNGWKYYLDDGTPATGLFTVGSDLFYFDSAGNMLTGWQWIDGVWYYFDPTSSGNQGRQWRGWLCDGGLWYYFNPDDGTMVKGWQFINGHWYSFKSSGEMKLGWQHIDNTWYYFNPSGDMRKGWLCDNGTWYAFASSGAMLVGRHVVDGLTCCFDSDGACTKTGWQNPAGLYQVSTRNVAPVRSDQGIFSYMTPSRVWLDMSRVQCIDTFIGRALEYVGTPYVWDYACAPGVGVDCAGLIMQSLYAIGVKTPYDPWLHWTDPWQDHNANNMFADSKFMWVDASQRERGDLVFWSGHVAIYLGGDLCIEAWPKKGVILNSVSTNPNGVARTPLGYRRVCV